MSSDHHRILRRVYVFFLLIFGVIAIVAGIALRSITRTQAGVDWVNHTYATIAELDGILANAAVGEGAARTYASTGEARDRAEARTAYAALNDHWHNAQALVRNDADATMRLLRLAPLLEQRDAFARQLLTARTEGDSARVAALLRTDVADEALEEIRRGIRQLRTLQFQRLTEQDQSAYAQAQTTRWVVGLGIGLNLLLLGSVAWLIRDNLAARNRLQQALEQSNIELEAKVRERTAELAAANATLVAENLERQWANQALQHQLHYNQTVVNLVDEPVLILTKVLRVTRINPAVTRLTGFSELELVGQALGNLVLPENTETDIIALLTQSLRDTRDLCGQAFRLKSKAGEPQAARLNLFPLRDGNKIVGGVLTFRLAAPSR